jgi:hypothetical protein
MFTATYALFAISRRRVASVSHFDMALMSGTSESTNVEFLRGPNSEGALNAFIKSPATSVSMLLATVKVNCQTVSEELNELNENDENYAAPHQDIKTKALVAVTNGKVAEASASNGPCHR